MISSRASRQLTMKSITRRVAVEMADRRERQPVVIDKGSMSVSRRGAECNDSVLKSSPA